ncbi:hypothetical protein T440DRAFT_406780 [Plenodomus tracheiphilus IPT5]|uniref:RING-type domain-containing protein n=1 Tax=Plenodomus tracheiphilus IPT5 TaxID=1408161 RepID=A0A6A7ARN4_9PLEO|nr:hypothetical protein T440DRAFT_406780 [Plenodomus tracheiphilus IPT5]
MASSRSHTFQSLQKDYSKGTEETRLICYECTSGAVISIPCGNVLHLGCLNTWLKEQDHSYRAYNCPCCRDVVFGNSSTPYLSLLLG